MYDLVSIVVPIYNKEDLLERCVDSLIGQTYPNLEILLIDDGSSDGSWAICQRYEKKDNRIKSFHKKNGGLSDARNYGLSKAIGKWISFVDPDDYVEPGYVEGLLGNSEDFELSVCCAYYVIHKQRKVVRHVYGNCVLVDKETIYEKILLPLITLDEKKTCLLHCVWNKLYKKEIIDKNRLTFDIIPLVEDYMFNVQYFNVTSKAKFTDDPLYDYVSTTPQSLSKNKNYIERINVSYYAHTKNKKLFPQIGEEVFPSVMQYNIKNNIYSYARNLGLSGFRSFCNEVYNLDAFVEISNNTQHKFGVAMLRKRNFYHLFICWAYLYSWNGFLKYYICKLTKR